MHAQEPLRPLDGLGDPPDEDGGGVGPDDGVRRGGGGDPAQHLVLDPDLLRHRLLDEVGAVDGGLERLRGVHAPGDRVGGVGGEQVLGGEGAGLRDEPVEVGAGGVGVDVGDADLGPGQGQDLGDPAAHVAAADHRDGASLEGHERSFRVVASRPRR
nr:hypothetical protein [Pseudonocardia sp. AL041005-10]